MLKLSALLLLVALFARGGRGEDEPDVCDNDDGGFELTEQELLKVQDYDPSNHGCVKANCDVCDTTGACFCRDDRTGKDCKTKLAVPCAFCSDAEACPLKEDTACTACDPPCEHGVCMAKTDGTIGCRCNDRYIGETCSIKSEDVLTFGRWKGYCTPCGGCGVQSRKVYRDGRYVDRQFRRCPPLRCPGKKRGKEMTGLKKNGEKKKNKEPYCCYSWATGGVNPVKTGNPYTGRPCANDGVNGFDEY